MSGGRQIVAGVATLCLVLQIASASLQRRSFETPNSSMWLASNLAQEGRYAIGELRAFHLPAEPLYLAFGFSVLPERAWPYLHVPVTVAFVTAVTAAALAVAGPGVALVAGLAATLDPFVLLHGPVWDDTFLAAALEWCLFAILALTATRPGGKVSGRMLIIAAMLAAAAAMTRTLSQVVLVSIALAALAHPRLRSLRSLATSILLGVVVALAVWGVRNAVVLGAFYIGTTHDGESFFESNCVYTRQGIREVGVVGFQRQCGEAQFEHASSLSELEANRQFRQYAFDYMAGNPVDTAKTALFKLLVTFSGFDFTRPAGSAKNVVAVGTSVTTLFLGLLGWWQLRRRQALDVARDVSLLLFTPTAISTVLMLAIGPTGLRYRLTLTGFLFVGLAMVVAAWIPAIRQSLRPQPAERIHAHSR